MSTSGSNGKLTSGMAAAPRASMSNARPTAVVTGASSGVGVDFARELAGRGYDLVLTARRMERLEAVRAELLRDYDVHVDLLASNLNSRQGAERLHADVCRLGRPVRLLVNNAGMGKFGSFLDQSLDDVEAMIQLNTVSLTVLAHLFAADFRQQGLGFILNHASFSALQPPPLYSVYAGTKAYVLAFSQALHQDLRRDGIRVSALCPGFFTSEFLAKANQQPSSIVKLIMLPSTRVARAGIRGVLRGKPVIIPGVGYNVLNLLLRFLPRSFATGLADFAVKH